MTSRAPGQGTGPRRQLVEVDGFYQIIIGAGIQAPHLVMACRLTNYETRLLNLLATSPGQVVARERLILALGQEPTAYDPRNLEILVRRLRRKSVQDLGEELPLATAHGVGFAFLADIRVVQ